MKKFISIIVILALVTAAGITEIFMSSGLFKDLNARLIEVNNSLIENPDDISNPDTTLKMQAVLDKWSKGKGYASMLANHTIVRALDEKLISLATWIETGGYEDARALCETAITLTNDLIDDTYPIITNLF